MEYKRSAFPPHLSSKILRSSTRRILKYPLMTRPNKCSHQPVIGSERSQKESSPLAKILFGQTSSGFGDNWKRGQEVTDIGNSFARSKAQRASRRSRSYSRDTGSPLDRKQQETTSGSLKQELKAPSSSLEPPPSAEISPPIGIWSDVKPLPETLKKSPAIYTFVVTINSNELYKTISNQLLLYAQSKSSGELQVQVRATMLGTRRAYSLTVKIPEQSGGVVTEVKSMLFWMNFVEILPSVTCYAGWTDIRSLWKPKEDQFRWSQTASGSPVTSILESGMLTWTPELWML